MAISERKTTPAIVRRVRANLWRRLLDRAAGLRPAWGRRLRMAKVADGCQAVPECNSELYSLNPRAKKLGSVLDA